MASWSSITADRGKGDVTCQHKKKNPKTQIVKTNPKTECNIGVDYSCLHQNISP